MEKKSARYQEIKDDIRKKIDNGELVKGQKIMSQAQLCKYYNVSRITAVRAINDLAAEGYIENIQGKGSFVKGSILKEGVTKLMGFTERMKQKNLSVTSKLLERSIVPAPKKMCAYFSLPENTLVIYLKRLRYVDGVPLCISCAYLMQDVFYWTMVEDLSNQSMFQLLEEKYKFKLGNGEEIIGVDYIEDEDAKMLECGTHDSCLKLSVYTYLNDQRPASFDETYYPADRYAYSIMLKRDS